MKFLIPFALASLLWTSCAMFRPALLCPERGWQVTTHIPALEEGTGDLASFVAAHLASEVPLPLPSTVIVAPINGPYWGLTKLSGDTLCILVESNQPVSWQVETLAHEWAHAATWLVAHEDPHDEVWGVVYSRCYRAMLDACAIYSMMGKSAAPSGGSPGAAPTGDGFSPAPPPERSVGDSGEELGPVRIDRCGLRSG